MKPAILALLGLTAAACAPSADLSADAAQSPRTSPRQCFDVDRVSNFSPGERGTLYIRSRGPDAGVFELSAPGCWEMDSAIQLALRAPGASGTRICEGEPVNIISPAGASSRVETCRAFVQRALTATEVEALPARFRP